MEPRSSYLIFCLVLLFAGCNKPGPVALVDNDLQSQDLEVLNTNVSSGSMFSGDDIDTNGLFLSVPRKMFGQLVLAGTEYDTPFEHHEAVMARAVFFDRSTPVLFHGDTVGYKTLDLGLVRINDIFLQQIPKKILFPRLGIDTILGYQYFLYNKDGTSLSGLQYEGSLLYKWEGTGSLEFPQFARNITSPPVLHVTSPKPTDVVVVSRNLPVTFQGGGQTIKVLISDVQGLARPHPIIQLQFRGNQKRFVIPETILKMLPQGRNRFVFTFSNETSALFQINGFGDDVLVTSIYSHSLLLQIRE